MARPVRRHPDPGPANPDPVSGVSSAPASLGVSEANGNLDSGTSQPETAPSQPEAPRPARSFDQALDQADAKAAQREPRKYRKRAPKQAKPAEVATDYTPILAPIFALISTVLAARGIEALSEQEQAAGVAAFTPLAAEYLPQLEGKAIWIAPVLWTGSVVLARVKREKNGE